MWILTAGRLPWVRGLVLVPMGGPGAEAWSWSRLLCTGPGAEDWFRSLCLVLELMTGTLSWRRRLELFLSPRAGPGAGDWDVILDPRFGPGAEWRWPSRSDPLAS